jgi:hypothetical protein
MLFNTKQYTAFYVIFIIGIHVSIILSVYNIR